MPPEVMDQRRLSFFSQEIRFPAERQIGFWKPEAVHDHCGMEGMLPMSGRKSAPSSPLEKCQSHSVEHKGLLQQSPSRDQKTKFHLEQHLVGLGSIAGRSIASREVTEQSKPDIYAEPVTKSMENRKPNFHGVHHKNCLFSSSLSETLNKNLNLSSKDPFCQHADIVNSKLEKGDPFESLEEIEAQTIGNLLPDDDDLLSGVTNGLESLDCIGRPIIADDTEDDLFYSGGGLELDGDVNSNCNRVSNFVSGRDSSSYNSGLGSAFSSEHSYGEHPSRALFSKNINSSIGDAELKDLLRSLHKASNRENHNQPVGQMSFGFQCMPTFNPVLPDYHDGLSNGIPCNSPGNMPGIPINVNTLHVEGTDNRHNHIVASGSLKNHSFEHNNGAFRSLGNHQSCALPGHQFFMNNCRSYQNHPSGSMMWPNSPSFNGIPAQHQQHMHGLPRVPSHMLNIGQPLQDHHVGSAPTLNPSIWDNPFPYAGDPVEASGFHPGSLGCAGFSRSSLMHPFQFASHTISPHSNGSHFEPSIGSACGGISSPQQRCLVIDGRNSLLRMSSSFNTPNDRARSRRGDANSNQAENKKQYELDTDRILRGEDTRTTLMIKNIPNKYTSKMLLATIDEHHRGTYDFIYLPIDFKNKCNVGYAFINMIDPKHIIPFYQSFNGKRWEKFNSEKVVSLAYARIQGKAALIAHFQNSSLMNEDKRCRPILFHSDGPNAGDQEPFPIGANVRPRPGRCRTSGNLENHQGSPSKSSNEDEIHSAREASSLSPPNNY